jgi:hypothetical protein
MAAGEPLQDVAWPAGFSAPAATATDWKQHSTPVGDLVLRVRLPPQWMRQAAPPEGMAFAAEEVTKGFIVQVRELEPVGFDFSQPLPNATIQESGKTVGANLAERGYDFVAAGQARTGARMWLWHEARMRSLGMFATVGNVAGGQSWTFTATPLKRRLEVNCFVLHYKGATPAESAVKTREAGAVFKAILQEVAIESR